MKQANHLAKVTDFDTINETLSSLLCNRTVVEVRLRISSIAIFFEEERDEDHRRVSLSSVLVIYGDSIISGIREAEYLQEKPGLEFGSFGLLLCECVDSVAIKEDGSLEICFRSNAILTVAGEQISEIEESWVFHASTDIGNSAIYSRTMPEDNLISVDSGTGELLAYLQPDLIISKSD